MRKFALLGVCLILIFLISGCTQFPIPGNFFQKQDKLSVGRGLKLSFADNAPPTDRILVGENSQFLVRVTIENYGEAVSGTLKIWDNIPGDKLEKDKSIPVDLKRADIRHDKNTDVIRAIYPDVFHTDTYAVSYTDEEIAPGTKLNVFAELTIPNFPAQIVTNICLKREQDIDPSCSNKEVIGSAQLTRQALYVPVTVDSIEKTATPLDKGNYFVHLNFKNLGGGSIFTEESTAGSEVKVRKDVGEIMTIEEGAVELTGTAGATFTCSPTKLIFENNAATLDCYATVKGPEETSVTYPLYIGYMFNYRMRIKAGPIPLVKISEEGTIVEDL